MYKENADLFNGEKANGIILVVNIRIERKIYSDKNMPPTSAVSDQ